MRDAMRPDRRGQGRNADQPAGAGTEVATRMADGAGWASLAAGLALTIAPSRCGWFGGLCLDRRVVRVYGVGDLVVGRGLLLGRNRAGWMMVRAGWNLVLAGLAGSALATGTARRGRAATLLGAMVVLAAADAGMARRLAAGSVGNAASG